MPSLLPWLNRLSVDQHQPALLAASVEHQARGKRVPRMPAIRLLARLELARHLRAQEVGKSGNVLVGILMHRSQQLVLFSGIGRRVECRARQGPRQEHAGQPEGKAQPGRHYASVL